MAKREFGLVFDCRTENCIEQMKTSHVYFVDDPKRGWHHVNDAPTHIMIEGENYKGVRVLGYTHTGKIKLIMIDVPYGTGNKDLAYDDEWVDAEDPFSKTKWLSHIQNRVVPARDLLTEDGILCMHIDDNNQAYAKVLLDQEFGEQNFVATLVWKKKATNGGISKGGFGINVQHEYVLVYAKDKSKIVINGVPGGEELDAKYKHEDDKGKYRLIDFAGYGLTYQASLDYEITSPEGKKIRANDVMGVGYQARWRWGKDTYEANKHLIVWVKGKPKTKTYMNGDCQMVHPSSLLDDKDLLANSDDTHKQVEELVEFPYRKPVNLMKRLLAIFSQKNDIVLDYYGGSGTTLQAVAELNKEDGGNRQCILITCNKEPGKDTEIARDITYPRLEKTIKEYTNLRYLRVETLKHTDKHPSDSAKIAQLQVENRMLPILSLLHNTHNAIEKNDKYTIFTNDNGTFFLGVFFNNDKLTAIKHDDIKKLRKTLKSYGKNAIEINTPGSGYAGEYYKFIQANNKG
jgi:adenine-specific DNA-methyltransferase